MTAVSKTNELTNTGVVSLRHETVRIKGVPRTHTAVRVNDQTFVVSGKLLRCAMLNPNKDAWQRDIDDPEVVIRALRASAIRIDLFRFWQRIPETDPKYDHYYEWRHVAAIPVMDYKHWFEKQIKPNARNKIRKAQKFGVVIDEARLSDGLISGITEIFNQSPVRRGKRFWHYGKNFETVKNEMSFDLNESTFITAYYRQELIGFIKLLFTDRSALLTLVLDKTGHRDKAPMNGMIAKAVEICASRGVPYLAYFMWRRAGHGDFQESNGFERIAVPEYFVPLTTRGALGLRLGLHKGVKGLVPDKLMPSLLALRSRWYARKTPKVR